MRLTDRIKSINKKRNAKYIGYIIHSKIDGKKREIKTANMAVNSGSYFYWMSLGF